MAKATFVLRKGKTKEASVQLFFSYGKKKRIRYSTGLKVTDYKNWDEKKMRIKNVISETHKNIVNNRLTEIQGFIESTYSKLAIQDGVVVTNEILKYELDVFFNKKIVGSDDSDDVMELMPFYEWFIKHYQITPLVTTGKPMGKGTAKTYRNAYAILKRFNDTVYSLTYDSISLSFYDDFLSFMYDQDYSLNYIGTQIKILKTILNASFDRDYHTNLSHKKRYFKKPSEEIYNIYLTQEELDKIYNVNLKNQPITITNGGLKMSPELLDNARDLFLISANSGLRVSDFNKLTTKNIITENGSEYISLVTTKGAKRLTIPINTMVRSIIDKRGGNPPHKMADQHINYCLKRLGKLAGLNEMITKEITKGGVKQAIKVEKYNLISNHTGRRSFCTNAYKSGMPTIDIMGISGHSSERVFFSYIKVDDIERAQKIAQNDFFM